MDFTTDKLRFLVCKWQSLIEAHVDVKTTCNFTLCMFCIAFTKRLPNQVKRTTYAQSSQICQIRRKMHEIMANQASSCDLKDLVAKFIPESIGKEIEKATTGIYPLQNVYTMKVKILKAPKFDLGKLMEEGVVCAVEFSHIRGSDLVNMAKKRTNVIPLVEDARYPAKYKMLVGIVDVIFSDIAQPDQGKDRAPPSISFFSFKIRSLLSLLSSSSQTLPWPTTIYL